MEDNKSIKIYGFHSNIEAIKSGKQFQRIEIKTGIKTPKQNVLLSLAKDNNIPVSFIPQGKFENFKKNHQGVIGIISPIEYQNLETLIQKESSPKVFLILDGITDVRNFGSIVRTANASGIEAVIVGSKDGALINQDSIKTSSGALFSTPICRVNHIKDAIFMLKEYGFRVFAASEKSDDTIYDIEIGKKEDIAILVGAEGRGITYSILKMADYKLKIPLFGQIESLNVSVATGIFLYEMYRKRL